MVTEQDRDLLDERLIVWPGPLPLDIIADPRSFARFVGDLGAADVIVDSLKDMVLGISEDKSGAAWNMARQECLARGINVLELHHQRKEQRGQNGGGKPKKLADVYGSRWLTAGAGSVVLLWGDPGDPIVEFLHLKQPAAPVGPFKVLIDHAAGEVSVHDGTDLFSLLKAARDGLTAGEAARCLFDATRPTPAQVEKARRQLDRLVRRELATEVPATRGGEGGSSPARWYARSIHEAFTPEDGARAFTPASRIHGLPRSSEAESIHGSNHGIHAGRAFTGARVLNTRTREPVNVRVVELDFTGSTPMQSGWPTDEEREEYALWN